MDFDVTKICRICLHNAEFNIYSKCKIGDDLLEIPEIVKYCLDIELATKKINFDLKICADCKTNLIKFYVFKKESEKAEKLFNQICDQPFIKSENENIEIDSSNIAEEQIHTEEVYIIQKYENDFFLDVEGEENVKDCNKAIRKDHYDINSIDSIHYKCSLCNKLYLNERTRNQHMREKHPDKNILPENFSPFENRVENADLPRKSKTQFLHRNFKNSIDTVCSKDDTISEKISKKEIHENADDDILDGKGSIYKCTVCNVSCIDEISRNQHMRENHHQEIKSLLSQNKDPFRNIVVNADNEIDTLPTNHEFYKCRICKRPYVYETSRNFHMREKHPEEIQKLLLKNIDPFETIVYTACNEKDKEILQKKRMQLMLYKGDSFKCQMCTKSYVHLKSRNLHMRKKHAVEVKQLLAKNLDPFSRYDILKLIEQPTETNMHNSLTKDSIEDISEDEIVYNNSNTTQIADISEDENNSTNDDLFQNDKNSCKNLIRFENKVVDRENSIDKEDLPKQNATQCLRRNLNNAIETICSKGDNIEKISSIKVDENVDNGIIDGKEPIYKCTICNRLYIDNRSRNQHMHENHHQEIKNLLSQNIDPFQNIVVNAENEIENLPTNHEFYKCKICKRPYVLEASRNFHMRQKHPEEIQKLLLQNIDPFESIIYTACNEKDKERLQKKRIRVPLYKGDSYKCKFCTKSYVHRKSRNIHMRKNHAVEVERLLTENIDPFSRHDVQNPLDIEQPTEAKMHNSLTKDCNEDIREDENFCNNSCTTQIAEMSEDENNSKNYDLFQDDKNNCKICTNVYRSSKARNQHMRAKHPVESKKFLTPKKTRSTSKTPIISTLNPVKDYSDNYCNICNQIFYTSRRYLSHLRRHEFSCRICSKAFLTKEEIGKHLCTGKNLFCKLCDKLLKSNSEIEAHREIHNFIRGLKFFTCIQCNNMFNSEEEIQNHTNECKDYDFVKKDNVFRCGICKMEKDTEAELKNHVKFHSKKFECPRKRCGIEFLTITGLTLHLIEKHVQDGKHYCKYCKDDSFENLVALHSHLRTCKERKYNCEICGKIFFRAATLKMHSHRHTEKKVMCDICGKSFAKEFELVLHNRMHTGEKPYKCTICGKAYKTSSHRAAHMDSHLNERIYKCDICDKTYKMRKIYRDHMKKHTVGKTHECEICQKKFFTKYNLGLHKKNMHSNA